MKSSEVGKYWELNAPSWTKQVRAGFDVYRDVLNSPAFFAALPDVTGMTGLDIGCGEGANTRTLAQRGARMTGIDIAPSFVAAAREFEPEQGIFYHLGDATSLPFEDAQFDFTTAFMSLMDMPDQAKALSEACRVTRPGGFLQFSILHPCFVPTQRKTVRDEQGKMTGVFISDYFTESEGDLERWHFSALPQDERDRVAPFTVPRFHRTLATWVQYICQSGWSIEAIVEPRTTPDIADMHPTVADTQAVPIFMIVRARKAKR